MKVATEYPDTPVYNPVKFTFRWIANQLAAAGFIDAARGERTADLAWPRMLTMFLRNSQRTADAAMVGIALGPAAIAGLAFATVYWGIGNSLSLGLANGTLTQVAQRFGAARHDALDLAVKQSVWIGILIALPFTLVFFLVPERLIGVFSADSTTVAYGAIYLQVLGFAMLFNFLNTIASRTLAGADDTWIPMSVRASGAFVNIVLNVIFIFGLGLGMAGAALGTLTAEVVVTVYFAVGFLRGHAPYVGPFPVELSVRPPYFDGHLARRLVKLAAPLVGRKLARRVASFPLLIFISTFGTAIVAAYEVSRRVQKQMSAPGTGFSMSASSLVGQELGNDNETGANAYCWDILRFSAVVYLVTGVFVFVFARPITFFFVQNPTAIDQTVPFIRVVAIALFGKGLDSSASGVLKGAGDTRWPLYARFVGLYLFLLPLAYLGTVSSLGIFALYLGLISEMWVPALITLYRLRSGTWKVVSRAYRPHASD